MKKLLLTLTLIQAIFFYGCGMTQNIASAAQESNNAATEPSSNPTPTTYMGAVLTYLNQYTNADINAKNNGFALNGTIVNLDTPAPNNLCDVTAPLVQQIQNIFSKAGIQSDVVTLQIVLFPGQPKQTTYALTITEIAENKLQVKCDAAGAVTTTSVTVLTK